MCLNLATCAWTVDAAISNIMDARTMILAAVTRARTSEKLSGAVIVVSSSVSKRQQLRTLAVRSFNELRCIAEIVYCGDLIPMTPPSSEFLRRRLLH